MSTLHVVWFVFVAAMLVVYVVLDGFDLGAGILHLHVAKKDVERRAVIRSVGPVWDGNEVWLIAGGGTLFMAFPLLFATAFSGFYLPLMIVLWLLAFRALGIELRHQYDHPLWNQLWDVAFAGASTLLALAFGAALGCVVRGVRFTDDGTFFAPLWTDLSADGSAILDWYTLLSGVTAVVALAVHGGLWLAARTDEEVQGRAAKSVARLWPVALVLVLALSAATWVVQPNLALNLGRHPLGLVLPLLGAGGFVALVVFARRGQHRRAFRASCAWIGGLLGSAAYAIFPMVLPDRAGGPGLRIEDVAAADHGLVAALYWYVPGMLLAIGYFVFLYRNLPPTFSVHDDAH